MIILSKVFCNKRGHLWWERLNLHKILFISIDTKFVKLQASPVAMDASYALKNQGWVEKLSNKSKALSYLSSSCKQKAFKPNDKSPSSNLSFWTQYKSRNEDWKLFDVVQLWLTLMQQKINILKHACTDTQTHFKTDSCWHTHTRAWTWLCTQNRLDLMRA